MEAREGSSAFGPRAAGPYATAARTADRAVHVALIGLTGYDAPHPSVRCEIDGTRVTARFPDGTWVLVALGDCQAPGAVELGGTLLDGPMRYARLSPGEPPVVIAFRPTAEVTG
ncbi:hypothetical protein [Streptomyces sp. NPDC017964]|uniref:hypothetical protein n=1 Tax=Streptomyces sp. NPDC017964 TaxID=3365022 RepID=UPI00379FCBA8